MLFSTGTMAEDKDQQAQLDEIKEQIKSEQDTNQKLKDDLASRDKEVADLKQNLKELEEKTKK
jgi:predicted nuclease with TOPRIM domain